MNDNELWFWLSSLDKAGPASLFPLIRFFGNKEIGISPKDKKSEEEDLNLCRAGARLLFFSDLEEIEETELVNKTKADYIAQSRDENTVQIGYQRLASMGVQMIPYISPDYPQGLRQLYDPPLCLYYKGSLPKEGEPMMAIVGARNCSEYGRSITQILSRTLALSGISIISGMARGIDSAAHRGCLDAGRRTYAVMGCGVDICYPKENQELYRQIIECGGIISEYPPGTQPLGWRFPMRNRLIAALSQGITVVEARQRSGSLITAERALELGLEIYAVPGRMDDLLSKGCNDLIQAGAQILTDPRDILDDFGLTIRRTIEKPQPEDRLQRKVLSHITLIPQTADEIAAHANESTQDIMASLITLEMAGYIRAVGKNQYVLIV